MSPTESEYWASAQNWYDKWVAAQARIERLQAADELLAEAADMLNNSPSMKHMDLGAKITVWRRAALAEKERT